MIKLILSILGPFIYLVNYWVCEYLYPCSQCGWDIFIPMDKLCHNFWAATILIYAGLNLFKTIYQITNYFIYFSICLSFFDVWARGYNMTDYSFKWYIISLISSFIISGIIYAYAQRNIDNITK